MAIDPGDIDFDCAYVDLLARITCARAAVRACAPAHPEKALWAARELYAFVMDGTSEDFKQLILPVRKR